MSLEYKKGDITTATECLIVHGCNAQGAMNSGVAKALRDEWPSIFVGYKALCNRHQGYSRELLGRVVPCPINAQQLVLNAITQNHYGKDGKKYVSYDAVDQATQAIAKHYADAKTIAMPKIGSGLGGGDWSIIEAIIKANLADYFQVVIYEGP